MAEDVERILAAPVIVLAAALGTSIEAAEAAAEEAVREGRAVKIIRGDEIRYGLPREGGAS